MFVFLLVVHRLSESLKVICVCWVSVRFLVTLVFLPGLGGLFLLTLVDPPGGCGLFLVNLV